MFENDFSWRYFIMWEEREHGVTQETGTSYRKYVAW